MTTSVPGNVWSFRSATNPCLVHVFADQAIWERIAGDAACPVYLWRQIHSPQPDNFRGMNPWHFDVLVIDAPDIIEALVRYERDALASRSHDDAEPFRARCVRVPLLRHFPSHA